MSKEQRKNALSQKNIDGVNKKREQLNQLINKLENLGISTRENSFYSYFICLEQLLFLIEKAKEENCSLGILFDNMKNCSFRTGDFYSEFYEIKKIKSNSETE